MLSLVDSEALERFPIIVYCNLSPISLHGELMHRHTMQPVHEIDAAIQLSELFVLVLEGLNCGEGKSGQRPRLVDPHPRPSWKIWSTTYSAGRHAQSLKSLGV